MLPVRSVNYCGGTVVDGEFAVAAKKEEKKDGAEEEGQDGNDGRDGDGQKSLRFRSTAFSRLNVTVCRCQFQRLLDALRDSKNARSEESSQTYVIFSLFPNGSVLILREARSAEFYWLHFVCSGRYICASTVRFTEPCLLCALAIASLDSKCHLFFLKEVRNDNICW